ncbi:hypothetical protein KAX02_00515 [candidate division WOR-3 bacterium]|nr:hypothetical protein [candidate division WOR-3 bacterium]
MITKNYIKICEKNEEIQFEKRFANYNYKKIVKEFENWLNEEIGCFKRLRIEEIEKKFPDIIIINILNKFQSIKAQNEVKK